MLSQWPLVLATTCLAAAAGLLACACALGLRGRAPRAQAPACGLALVLLAAGGFGLVARTQHWERLFNSFTHLASAMTQEFICVALFALVAIVFLVAAGRNDGEAPPWACAAGLLVSVALVVAVGRALVIPSKPVADVAVEVLTVFAAACLVGPALFAVIEALAYRADRPGAAWPLAAAGAGTGLVLTVASLVYLQVSGAAAAAAKSGGVTFGVDPTKPTSSLASSATALPFSEGTVAWSVAAIVGAAVACTVVVLGRRRLPVAAWGALACAAGIVAAVCTRIVTLQVGAVYSIRF